MKSKDYKGETITNYTYRCEADDIRLLAILMFVGTINDYAERNRRGDSIHVKGANGNLPYKQELEEDMEHSWFINVCRKFSLPVEAVRSWVRTNTKAVYITDDVLTSRAGYDDEGRKTRNLIRLRRNSKQREKLKMRNPLTLIA